MAKTYELTPYLRFGNRLMLTLIPRGVGPRSIYLLTVAGRKSGKPRTTPVSLVEHAGERWLVAPYGPVGWVHNARAAGKVTLRRGRHAETVAVTEVVADEAAPVLKHYVGTIRVVRPYFDVTADSSVEDFAAEAPRHPVFKIGERSAE